jgi:hypothetical protein
VERKRDRMSACACACACYPLARWKFLCARVASCRFELTQRYWTHLRICILSPQCIPAACGNLTIQVKEFEVRKKIATPVRSEETPSLALVVSCPLCPPPARVV